MALAKQRGTVSGNVTGHSLRTAGVQRLARAGVSESKNRWFGRGASQAMLEYVREAWLAEEGIAVVKEETEREEQRADTEQGSSSSVHHNKSGAGTPGQRQAIKVSCLAHERGNS